jgi:hypothetical protein
MDKKALALSGLSALLLASTSSGDAEAQQRLATPPVIVPKMTVSPATSNAARAIDTQRSKSISAASPAATLKLNRIQADHESGWIEHFANGHTSTTNPIGNVQKTLNSR